MGKPASGGSKPSIIGSSINDHFSVTAQGTVIVNGVVRSYTTFIDHPEDAFWDGGGGTNTLEFAFATADIRMDLGPVKVAKGSSTYITLGGWQSFNETGTSPIYNEVTARLKDQFVRFQNVTLGAGDDYLMGSHENNVLKGGGGNDYINGDLGVDVIDGGAGNDILVAGGTTYNANQDVWDQLTGGTGNDTFVVPSYEFRTRITDYEVGRDLLVHAVGYGPLSFTPTAYQNAPAVLIHMASTHGGVPGLVMVVGTDDPSALFIVDQSHFRHGSERADVLVGTADRDAIFGGRANDLIQGMGGNDLLDGESGDDTIEGGDGDDIISGGFGRDIMAGGLGSDTFVFEAGHSSLAAPDVVQDFDAAFDLFDLRGLGLTWSAGPVARGVWFVGATEDAEAALYADLNGDQHPDMMIVLLTPDTITAAQLLL
jgi:Ca2+-binding RTX toxin-like protein